MLCAQVGKLRQEKDVLEGKLREFERSLQKLKDCTFQEATQKRSYERKVQQVEAEIRGAELREKVGHVADLLKLVGMQASIRPGGVE